MLEKLPVAFLAGLVSVITPCVLPLVPGYLSALSVGRGRRGSASGASRGRSCSRACRSSSASRSSSSLLGAAAAAIGSAVDQRSQFEIAGFVLVVLGLAFLGALPWPERAVAPGLLQHARGSGSRLLLGGAFAVCAAPCIGTVLASILVLASSSGSIVRGVVLLVAYSLGLGAAFVAAGVAFAHAMRAFRWVRDHYAVVRVLLRRDARRARAAALLQPRLVAARRARPGVHADRPRLALASRRSELDVEAAVRRRERREPAQRLQPLALGGDRFAATVLVRRDDDVHESLEEVALVGRARAPGQLELLVRLEVRTARVPARDRVRSPR